MSARLPAAVAAVLLIASAPLLAALPAAAAPPPTAGPGPGTPLSAAGNDTGAFDIAYGPSGDATAAWTENANGTYSLWTARYLASSGWGPADLRATATVPLGTLSPGMDRAGNTTLFWVQFGTPHTVWFLRDAPGARGAPTLLHTSPQLVLNNGDAAVGADGSAFLFWTDYNTTAGTGYHLRAVVGPDGSVSGPDLIPGNPQATFERAVLPDPTGGGATALWCDRTGANANLTESRYTPGSNWSLPVVVVPNYSNGCSIADAAIDAAGNITVLMDAYYYGGLVTVRHPAGAPWGSPVLLWNSSALSVYIDRLQLEAAPDGHLMAAWRNNGEPFDTSDLYAAGYSPGTGWTALQHPVSGSITAPDFTLAESASGGVLLYSHYTGANYTLNALEFSPLAGCGGWSDEAGTGIFEVNPNILASGLPPSGAGHVLYHTWDGSAYRLFAADVRAAGLDGTLTLSSPPDGLRTSAPVAVVAGATVPGSSVSVGGLSAAAGPDGTFSAAVPLAGGDNVVEVTASLGGAFSGCSVTATLTVTFDDPLPPLLDELNATRADLSDALTRVADLEAAGNATRAELDDALANLSAALDALDAAVLELTQVRQDLATVNATLATYASGNAERDAALAAAQADLSEAQARVLLLELQQNQTTDTLRDSTADNAALAGQVAVLSIVAFAALIAGIGAVGLALVQARRGGGGGGGTTDRQYNKRKFAQETLEEKPEKE
jgi:hypothetical protein